MYCNIHLYTQENGLNTSSFHFVTDFSPAPRLMGEKAPKLVWDNLVNRKHPVWDTLVNRGLPLSVIECPICKCTRVILTFHLSVSFRVSRTTI